MKTLKFATIITLLAISTSCLASSIELERTGQLQTIQLCVEKQITDQLGAFALSTNNKFWGQTYVGLTYAPIPNILLALGTGSETGGNRTGGWIWAGKNRLSAIYAFENGASGPWHKLVAKFSATPKLNLGYTEKSNAGGGVYVDFRVSKTATLKYSGFKKPEIALNISF